MFSVDSLIWGSGPWTGNRYQCEPRPFNTQAGFSEQGGPWNDSVVRKPDRLLEVSGLMPGLKVPVRVTTDSLDVVYVLNVCAVVWVELTVS